MKILMITLGLAAVACLAACAALPSKATIAEAVTDPRVDAAAIRFETAIAAMLPSIGVAVTAPDSGVDPVEVGKAVRKAVDILDEARAVFDARSGNPADLVGKAFDVLDEAIPPSAGSKVRFALAIGRGAASVFAGSALPDGPPSPPSPDLKAARDRTDDAVKALLARLPAS